MLAEIYTNTTHQLCALAAVPDVPGVPPEATEVQRLGRGQTRGHTRLAHTVKQLLVKELLLPGLDRSNSFQTIESPSAIKGSLIHGAQLSLESGILVHVVLETASALKTISFGSKEQLLGKRRKLLCSFPHHTLILVYTRRCATTQHNGQSRTKIPSLPALTFITDLL
jgi:hypothetical protein